MNKMKLIVKFNLVLLVVFGVAFLVTGLATHRLLQRNAKEEILENARIMSESAVAVRAYTDSQIGPLLATQLKYTFLPQSIPHFAASQYFHQLRKKFPDYSYKEATLNPTNPADRATDWEADIIQHFREFPQKTEMVGMRDTPSGRVLYMARPMPVKNAACMGCHSTPENAPKTMIEQYGSANGFGWKLNDIQTAQIVSAPMKLPIHRAGQVFGITMISLGAVFATVFLAVNAMLILLVTRRVERLSKIADEVSLGNMDAPEFPVSGKDEIAGLAESFTRMRKSLAQAIKMLEQA
jgi:protein-histidine pros-kinase